jgi:hypothetical protein
VRCRDRDRFPGKNRRGAERDLDEDEGTDKETGSPKALTGG